MLGRPITKERRKHIGFKCGSSISFLFPFVTPLFLINFLALTSQIFVNILSFYADNIYVRDSKTVASPSFKKKSTT